MRCWAILEANFSKVDFCLKVEIHLVGESSDSEMLLSESSNYNGSTRMKQL